MAHKIVLASSSRLFYNLFIKNDRSQIFPKIEGEHPNLIDSQKRLCSGKKSETIEGPYDPSLFW